jgi:ABC-type dipeptide/oligopeptide/nickel transport system ATPase component
MTAIKEAATRAAAMAAAKAILRVEDLRTEFRTGDGIAVAVDGLSLDLREGETLAIVGESGSGKSVTALSLLRLIPEPPGRIVSGSAWFGGRDLLKLTTRRSSRFAATRSR